MPKPTAQQVDEERKALKRLKKHIPTVDAYRVNRHNLVDAQIQVLGMKFTLEEIKAAWSVEDDSRGAAEDALYWMQGGKIPSPTQMWLALPAVRENLAKSKK